MEEHAKRTWVRALLEELRLVQPPAPHFDPLAIHSQVEHSGLLGRLREVSQIINREAGVPLLEEKCYLPPSRRVCSFIFTKGEIDHVMTIRADSPGARLLFFSRRHDLPSAGGGYYGGLSYSLRRRPKVKLSLSIDPMKVTESDVQRWFAYLLSGLREAYRVRGVRNSSS